MKQSNNTENLSCSVLYSLCTVVGQHIYPYSAVYLKWWYYTITTDNSLVFTLLVCQPLYYITISVNFFVWICVKMHFFLLYKRLECGYLKESHRKQIYVEDITVGEKNLLKNLNVKINCLKNIFV